MSKVKLCDICDFQGGSQPPKSQWITLQQDGYIRMLQIRDFTQPGKVKEEYVKLTNTTKCCLKDDILIARYGASLGKILTGLSGAYNVAMTKAVPNEAVISKKFLYYFLCSDTFQNCILNVGVRAAQAGFNKEDLSNIEIYCPDLSIQNKICKILELVDVLINKSKLQLDELDLLVKSRFIELFGDPVSNTKNIPVTEIAKKFFVTKLAGFEYTKYIKYQDSGDVIMVRGLNVKDKKLKLDDVYYIDSEVSDKLPRSQLKENDIVMTYVGVNIGDVALVDAKNKYHLAPNVAKISPYDINETNPVFFVYLLAFNKENFAGNATNTAKQALNMEKIRKLQIILPKIELQNQFADFVAQVDKSKLAIQQSLDELETLKKSLMQQYFG